MKKLKLDEINGAIKIVNNIISNAEENVSPHIRMIRERKLYNLIIKRCEGLIVELKDFKIKLLEKKSK